MTICKYMYLQPSVLHFYHIVIVTLHPNFDHSVFTKNYENIVLVFFNAEKNDPKNRNGQILNPFLP